jgi:hypothetical protein
MFARSTAEIQTNTKKCFRKINLICFLSVGMEEVGFSVEDLTLDTVEFCPSVADVGVVGGYDLHPDGKTRRGSLALFRIQDEQVGSSPKKLEWLWRRQEAMEGVLDFKWCAFFTPSQ